ncbi:hypothetical protein MRS44_004132 [Fusarium solani]|uniref:uncharacterized protein n=1 Tax=Fusarium solani TaxID=169388 RepID=UPI0032C48D27|nr:hypothetical protein MRS44_004132 [Fusarium solani]
MAKRKYGPIIYLNGYPGAGKRTIANELYYYRMQRWSATIFSSTPSQLYLRNTPESISGDTGDTGDSNTQLNDLEALSGLREGGIFHFGGELEMELDVTNLSTTEAARRICDHVYKVAPNNLAEPGAEAQSSRRI